MMQPSTGELLTLMQAQDPPAEEPKKLPEDPAHDIMRRCKGQGIPLEVRDTGGSFEVFAKGMPEDLKAEAKRHCDPLIRAIWLRNVLVFLGERGLDFTVDAIEDLNLSAAGDGLGVFRENLRGWVREAMRGTA